MEHTPRTITTSAWRPSRTTAKRQSALANAANASWCCSCHDLDPPLYDRDEFIKVVAGAGQLARAMSRIRIVCIDPAHRCVQGIV